MMFVKGQSRRIAHGSLQQDRLAFLQYQPAFSGLQQEGTNTGALSIGTHVNGKDVSHAGRVGFSHNKSQNSSTGLLSGLPRRAVGHQSEGPRAIHIPGKLMPGICDPFLETFLVNAPELVKIRASILAQIDHP